METSPAPRNVPQRRATTSTARPTVPQRRSIDVCNFCAIDGFDAVAHTGPDLRPSLGGSHLDDLPHLDKKINYEWYAEALVKTLKCIERSNPEDTTGANGSHLLEYHIILSRLFTSVVHSPSVQKYPEVLCYILHHLSNIWTQLDWKTNMIDPFCSILFRTTFLDVIIFFEQELEDLTKKSSEIDQDGCRSYATLTTLLQLILPLLLMLLQHIQALWTEAVASNIPDVLEGAKFRVLSKKTRKVVDAEEQEENAIREWLETIRQSGYKVIGCCAKLNRMFNRILDSSAVRDALMKDLKSMGFHHLKLLIEHTIIPLIKNCHEELGLELVDGFLYPVFHYFHHTLFESWCGYLNEGIVRVPDTINYVSVSEEMADKFQIAEEVLIQLTRAASDLLAVIASPELNGGLCPTSPQSDFSCATRSLVWRVLFHPDLRQPVLSLIYYIFGLWKDDTAKATSVSFCHMIVQFAKATHNEELVSYVQENIIPVVIRCLTLESISDSSKLTDLCRDAYNCVQNPDLVCKGEYSESAEVFDSWLEKQKIVVRCRNTPFHELDEFVWPWEDEEEFKDYLPACIDMLCLVDKMNDCLECRYSPGDLFGKLNSDFVTRYAIDSSSHDYVWTMSDMLSRKISAKHWQREHDQLYNFLSMLIDLKPYIQHSSYDESLVARVQNLEFCSDFDEFRKASALKAFCSILSLWEPQFHPLIREGHKDALKEMCHHSIYLEYITFLQPLQPVLSDFPARLRPLARNYIDDNKKLYHMAKNKAKLHEDFDAHVSSGVFDDQISKGAQLHAAIVDSQFPDLDHSLIKLSFERRGKLLDMRERLHSYHNHLRDVIGNEQMRIKLQSLMLELEASGFFNIVDDSIDWDKECFSQLMDKFEKQVFTGLDLPKHCVARGIMDYWAMSSMKNDSCSWDTVFEKVVGEPYRRWIQNIPLYWMDTRYYKHWYYDIIQQPFEEIWLKEELI